MLQQNDYHDSNCSWCFRLPAFCSCNSQSLLEKQTLCKIYKYTSIYNSGLQWLSTELDVEEFKGSHMGSLMDSAETWSSLKHLLESVSEGWTVCTRRLKGLCCRLNSLPWKPGDYIQGEGEGRSFFRETEVSIFWFPL